jgi:site-specific DNA-methyltransferase (adenine-specific)
VPPGGAVLDPFAGSGTVGMAALRRGCTFVGIEKESAYVEIARKRLAEAQGPLFPVREDKA